MNMSILMLFDLCFRLQKKACQNNVVWFVMSTTTLNTPTRQKSETRKILSPLPSPTTCENIIIPKREKERGGGVRVKNFTSGLTSSYPLKLLINRSV